MTSTFEQGGAPISENTRTLLAAGPVTTLPFDPLEIDGKSDADLDALAHGVIALDSHGIVLRYNLAEARLARLDRHSVLGRDFFTEVAPCTKTIEFEGVFRKMVESGAQRAPRFAYLFDFKFGSQVCDVELVKAANAARYYVFVTRRDFAEARGSLPSGWAAPLQKELDPDDGAADGVLRDTAEQRVLHIDADFVATFLATAREHYPLAWPRLCFDWGQRYGRRLMVALEVDCATEGSLGLEELAFSETIARIRRKLALAGWGDLRVDVSLSEEGLVLADIRHSLLAEIGATQRNSDGSLSSSLIEGMLSAVFTHLSGRTLAAVELPSSEAGLGRFVILRNSLRAHALTLVHSGVALTPRALVAALGTTMERSPHGI